MARGWPCCAKAWQAHHAPHTSKRFAVSSSPSTPPWRACSPATCAWYWWTRSKKPSPTWPSAAPKPGPLRDGPQANGHLGAATAWVGAAGTAQAAPGEKIGTVDTAFQWIGRDHDILVEAYDDPGVL